MHQFVGGRRRAAVAGDAAPGHRVLNPATGETVETVRLAGPADVDAAATAARHAFAGWSRATPGDRATVLTRLAAGLAERADELARVEPRQTGKPIRLSTGFDVPGTVDNVAFCAGAARALEGRAAGECSADHTSSVRREPIGVVGSIVPWNHPLQMAAWKVLPAVAAGNTVVTGSGPVAGEAVVCHPDVDMVSFTGSAAVGRRVMGLAASGPRRVHLELGGEAPFVVFDDADLEAAVHGVVAGALINTGRDCTAATRAYVQRPRYDAFVSGVADLMGTVRLGDPFDERTDQGPLVSPAQQQRVAGFVDRARSAGAKVQALGFRQGHVRPLLRGVHQRQTRDVRRHGCGQERMAPHELHRTRRHPDESRADDDRGEPAR